MCTLRSASAYACLLRFSREDFCTLQKLGLFGGDFGTVEDTRKRLQLHARQLFVDFLFHFDIPFLKGISKSGKLHELANLCTLESREKDFVVIEEGKVSGKLYFVVSRIMRMFCDGFSGSVLAQYVCLGRKCTWYMYLDL